MSNKFLMCISLFRFASSCYNWQGVKFFYSHTLLWDKNESFEKRLKSKEKEESAGSTNS